MADIDNHSGEAKKCRERALACRKSAETSHPIYRARFMAMAETWARLADHYEWLALNTSDDD